MSTSRWRTGRPPGFYMALTLLLMAALGSCQSLRPNASGRTTAEPIVLEPRAELSLASPIPLDASEMAGKEIGFVYEAYLSPEQEGGEEEETPGIIPDTFRSTAPSVDRVDRPSRGHGVLAITRDLSAAYVFVEVQDVKLDEINMFHIHCGRPGQLGPILVDFSLRGDLLTYLEDGRFAIEITNEDIAAAASHGEGIVGAFAAGCPIAPALPTDKVKTIGGMQFIAEQGELYFNLHTAGQTFFGDIRGQLMPVR